MNDCVLIVDTRALYGMTLPLSMFIRTVKIWYGFALTVYIILNGFHASYIVAYSFCCFIIVIIESKVHVPVLRFHK